MTKILDTQVDVEIEPWIKSGDNKQKTGLELDYIQVSEFIGGSLASGTIVFRGMNSQVIKEMSLSRNDGIIKFSNLYENSPGESLVIPFFIRSRHLNKERLTLEIICIKDPRFISDPISMKYNNVREAIDHTLMGIKFTNEKILEDTNISNLPINQMMETNYDFLKKLSLSYKKDTVFAFGFEGLTIKERDPSDKKILSLGNLFVEEKNRPIYKFNEVLTKSPFNSGGILNASTIVNFDSHHIVHHNYSQLVENYLYNSRFYIEDMYSRIIVTGGSSLPVNKIGDAVIVSNIVDESEDFKFPDNQKEYIVSGIEIFYSAPFSESTDSEGRKFSFNMKLLGINKGSWNEL